MNIIACCKIVPEDQDIAVKPDRTLDLSKAEPKISQYDLNAIEAAIQIKEQSGNANVVALSAGAAKTLGNSKIRKDILSRGVDSLTLVADDSLEGRLPADTASVLAAAARKTGFDLILCGEGSGDIYAQQVGILLGEMLGVASINGVSRITAGDGTVLVERTLEDEIETLELALPAVVSVTADINTPRIPSLKTILAAGKKPTVTETLDGIGYQAPAPVAAMTSVKAPEQSDRKKKIIDGDSDADIKAFIESIRPELTA
ncbi:MAG: electron transfer flavoprotein [Telmatospirillum sp.]|nr:electron transfer flavoprotein [Telmatospirillum sp.]